MSLELVVSNPPRSNRRARKGRKSKGRKRRKLTAAQQKFFGKKKRGSTVAKSRKRRSAGRKSSRRRRRSGGGMSLGGFSILPSIGTLKSAAASVGGFYAVNKAVEKLQANKADGSRSSFADDPAGFPMKTVGIKVAVACLGGAVLGKTAGREIAQSFTLGGLTAAGIDVAAHFLVRGNAGLGADGGAGDAITAQGPENAMAYSNPSMAGYAAA